MKEKNILSRPASGKEPGAAPLPAASREAGSDRPFDKVNFLMMAGCLVLIIVGFCLMAGPGSNAENGFNPDIFSARRIVAGPAVAFAGFLLMAFAIVRKPKSK